MNIQQNLESNLIGVGDNYIVLQGVEGYVDVAYTTKGIINETFNFRYTANYGEVNLNLREVTRLVYDNLENYEDPFDYQATKLFTEVDAYHFMILDINIIDGIGDEINVDGTRVINAALDVGECLILTSIIDEVLDDNAGKGGNFVVLDGLNFDLNRTLH